jgi:uncharacterized protein (TIGR03067 family)
MDDLNQLQGSWKQTRFEENGVIEPPDVHGGNGAITTIDGDRFAVHSTAGELLLAGRFILDSSKTPKSVTWIDSMGDDAGKRLVNSQSRCDSTKEHATDGPVRIECGVYWVSRGCD